MIVEKLDNGIYVAREDLCEGGSKVRFLPQLVKGADHIVYGGSLFCGGAALALSVVGKYLHKRVTLFYAKRAHWHPRQVIAQQNGATLIGVPMGFQKTVLKRASVYASEHGALVLPIGFDMQVAEEALMDVMMQVRHRYGVFESVYCACSTGMLTRSLARAFPEAEIVATVVGLKTYREKSNLPANVTMVDWPAVLSRPVKTPTPFPCCPYYERKAWMTLLDREKPPTVRRVLFWNVLGDVGVIA